MTASQGVQDREVLARLEGLALRISEVGSDAREARDLALKLLTVHEQQDVAARLEQLRAQVTANGVESRADLVNAITHARDETQALTKDLDVRVQKLEDAAQATGARASLMTWLAQYAPGVVALLIAIATALGLGARHH